MIACGAEVIDNHFDWNAIQTLSARNYRCGHAGCGKEVSSEKGWRHSNPATGTIDGDIYSCPNCKRPTFFDRTEGKQVPGIALGSEVQKLPAPIQALWSEIRTSTSHSAFTAAVLAGRTLLMHIAVEQGATAGQSFLQYVNYLVDNHFAPRIARHGSTR